MNALRILGGAALTALLVVCSQLPYAPDSRQSALLRLSWRAVGERVEECRRPGPEELAALPRHMRRAEICEGRLAPFRLSVALDGEPVYVGLIHASGAREDRPTYVYRQFDVEPGTHRLSVEFATDHEGSERVPLRLDTQVTLAPRQVLLITHDAQSDRLIVFEPTS